jgi:hypothetical protein
MPISSDPRSYFTVVSISQFYRKFRCLPTVISLISVTQHVPSLISLFKATNENRLRAISGTCVITTGPEGSLFISVHHDQMKGLFRVPV